VQHAPVCDGRWRHEQRCEVAYRVCLSGDARLRNLTYCAPLFVDVKETTLEIDDDGIESVIKQDDYKKVLLGRVPICPLSSH